LRAFYHDLYPTNVFDHALSIRLPEYRTMMRTIVALGMLALVSACKGDRPGGETSPPKRFTGAAQLEVTKAGGERMLRGDSLQLSATTSIDQGSLIVRASLRNVSRRTVHLQWGWCGFSPQLYANDGLTGHPVFDWQQRPNPDPEIGRWYCPAMLKTADLEAGDSLGTDAFVERIPIRRLAGDSLAPGSYHVGAQIGLAVSTPATTEQIVVPAGVVQLRR
jgi:hypothetical protein